MTSALDYGDKVTLLALLRLQPDKMSWRDIASEVALAGSATKLWDEHFPLALDGIKGNEHDALEDAAQTWAEWGNRDFDVLTVLDPNYPVLLKSIHEVPPLLFCRGEVRATEPAVSIVGSRAATSEGLKIAGNIARGLVDRGITVLSGLAAGIDTAAHTTTIEAGGRPVGVIGTGITRTYPAENRDLHHQVAEFGALVSQFLPDAPPAPRQFRMRNATMSGMGLATVVVEAGEHSGARIQARVAIAHGRPVVLTELVTARTQWGRELSQRPGVYVADSTKMVMEIIDRFVRISIEPALPVLT